MRLLGLEKDCFSNWWSSLPAGSTLVVQPKIIGCAIGLRYKYGQLVDAYTRENKNVIENIRTINSIPLSIDDSLKVEVELEGILFFPFHQSNDSKPHIVKNLNNSCVTNQSLSFLAYQISCSNSDELSDLTQLQDWGFEVPMTLRTDDPKQVKIWYSQWLKKELFSNVPTNGIVAKCNSFSVKNYLGLNPSSPKWALALTS
tara:strand:+ start:496 stop:1098 length:603 start_codon:yes stop_codon:yes gene_type:complete